MVRYKMLGRDVNSYPIQYRTWVVDDEPDFTGDLYSGLKSGTSPLVDISATAIQDGYAVVDFSLPFHSLWQMIQKTLPIEVSDSQLAVVDGYAYLFGGQNSDVILRAELANPADWEDTGARLPNTLGKSQLAIIDGYMYLFGGVIDGYTSTDIIYQASINDPLSWSDSGSTLPFPLRDSQLGIADGYMYLFGGYADGYVTDSILRSTTLDPLTWIDTGAFLPQAVCGSHIGLVNDTFYLFGGTTDGYTPIDIISSAPLSDPTNFTNVGNFSAGVFYGQFFTYGDSGYLIAPSASSSTNTIIWRCDLSDPSSWENSSSIKGNASHSQVAIIYDRIFLFGGSGSGLIFTHEIQLKFPITAGSPSQIYGDITRTQYQSTINQLDLIKVIGFPYWKTNYQQ